MTCTFESQSSILISKRTIGPQVEEFRWQKNEFDDKIVFLVNKPVVEILLQPDLGISKST
jgi:hypothetical protein